MTSFRHALPQLRGEPFLTDGGIETSLIFHHGLDLPLFASYVLLDAEEGRAALKAYYRDYLKLSTARGVGFLLESPTWRCSTGWGARLGHDGEAVAAFNRDAVRLMEELRDETASPAPIVISGNIGPRGDGYAVEQRLTEDEAERYHSHQIRTFADTAADMVTAVTMTHTEEAIGIVRAAGAVDMPVAIAFTTETDGRLPSGETLAEAIEAVDHATGSAAAYYMINCAHPDHFADALEGGDWRARIRGVRANASRKSHAELDESDTLDPGDPEELARDYVRLRRMLPNLSIFGGCCGTDHRHIERIGDACLAAA
ncbi:homocysteine S-methyltransferase family protein [Lutibaculum baratangense]|nr:homocysteine S-methyltransferase family protein [Lutibaculum baratangense]